MPNTRIETRADWVNDAVAVVEALKTALRETLRLPPENWGIHGGEPASEVGFEIKV